MKVSASHPRIVSLRVVVWLLCGILTAAACIAIPAWQLLDFGPFSWHVEQPQYWQGGIEALVLIGLLGAAQWLRRPAYRVGVTLVLTELYLRRHAVDLPLLVDLAYFEIVVGLGAGTMRLVSGARPVQLADYLRCFVLGLCVWSVCAWSISAFGFGSVHDLRWLTLILAIPALAARSRPWTLFVLERVWRMPASARVGAGALLGWLLVLCARADVVASYDALWYGLRGEYVLVGAGSAYVGQNLVAPAYYVPKLYDLFLIPLSGLGSSSVIIGMTVLIAVMLATAAYELMTLLGIRDKTLRILGVSLCLTLPAIANTALEPKPDILAAFLLILAWSNGARFIATRDPSAMLWTCGLALLSTQVKLTAIPYAGVLLFAIMMTHWVHRAPAAASTKAELRLAWTGFALMLMTITLVMARTLVVAGMPTIGPIPLFKLWQWLGFQLKPPAGAFDASVPQNWSDVPTLALDLLFRPQRLGHMVITWIGNLWLWFAAMVLLMRPWIQPRPATPIPVLWPGLGLALSGLLLLFGWGFQERGGDGNYFIAALLPAILIGTVTLWRSWQAAAMPRMIFFFLLGGFCLFQACYSFASGQWTPGTREFDLSFNRGAHSFRKNSRLTLQYYGIAEIAAHLRALPGAPHVVGYVDDEAAFRLPASFEGLLDVSYSRPELVNDRALFLKYCADSKINYLIMPHEHKTNSTKFISPTIAELAEEFATNPRVIVLKDSSYDMYDLSGWKEIHSIP
jgi:hypothetical protein